MTMKRIVFFALGLTFAPAAMAQTQAGATATPAPAAQAAAPAPGAAIFDPTGVQVGTVDSVTAQAVVVSTGTSKVAVPPTAIGPGAKGLTISLTKAQLDAAVQQQQAQASAALSSRLVAGTSVKGTGGATLGTIKSSDGQTVTMTTARGVEVKLPVSGFGAGPANDVVLGMTAAQLDAATSGAAPATGGAAATTTGTATTNAATTGGTMGASGTAGATGATSATAPTDTAASAAQPSETRTTTTTKTKTKKK